MSDSPVAIIYGSDGYGGGYKEKGTVNTPFRVDGYGTAGIPRGGVVTIQGVVGGTPMPISGVVTTSENTRDGYGYQISSTLSGAKRGLSISTDGYSVAWSPVKIVSPNRLGTSLDGYSIGRLPTFARIDGYSTGPFPTTVRNQVSTKLDGYSTGAIPVSIRNNILKERLDGYSIGPLPVLLASPNRVKTSIDGYSVAFTPVKIVSPNRLGTSLDGYSIGRLPTFAKIDGYSTGPLPVRISNNLLGNRIDGYSVSYVPVKLVSPNKVSTSTDGYSVAWSPVKIVSPNRLGVSIDGYSIGPLPVRGTVTANQGIAAALAGAWPVKVTDGTNSMPTGDAAARGIYERITDGTNTAAVKAASTAAVAGDPALVVAISPNNSPGNKTNNNAAPGANNLGALVALANAAAPTWTEGNLVLLSALLNGALRMDNTTWLGSTAPTVGQKTMANSLPVAIASDQYTAANTAALTNVAGSASSVTLLAANTSRIIATIHNDSTSILYVKFGTTASTSSFTVRLVPNAYYEVPVGRDGGVYNGRIDGIWASATGNARITEVT